MTLKDLLDITQADNTLELFYPEPDTSITVGVYAVVPALREDAETDEDFPSFLLPYSVSSIAPSIYAQEIKHTHHLSPHLLVYLNAPDPA